MLGSRSTLLISLGSLIAVRGSSPIGEVAREAALGSRSSDM